MLKITLSFANLSAQDAETLADTHACENGFVDGFQDFVAWFDDSSDLECWSQALIQDAHSLGATMVAAITDEVKNECWCKHWYGSVGSDHECS